MPIIKIISGGQTGVDVVSLLAAKVRGIQTGGTMPRGFITLLGPKPEYAVNFGMVEHASDKYPPRTEENVRNSDGTIQIASHWDSPGEILTSKLIKKVGRPGLKVDFHKPLPASQIVEWLESNRIAVLNVAGNAHRTNPQIGLFAFGLLGEVLSLMGRPVLEVFHQGWVQIVGRLTSPPYQ